MSINEEKYQFINIDPKSVVKCIPVLAALVVAVDLVLSLVVVVAIKMNKKNLS